jgi:mitochondrial fission protein ELM1
MAKPLTLLTLLINKIGHRHQAEGVARVVGRMCPAESVPIEIRPRVWAPPAIRNLSVAAAGLLGIPAVLRAVYGIDPDRLPKPDLIVGSGRPAVPVGILLGRHFGVPHVYSGLADGMALASAIDLRLVSVKSFADRPNAVLTPVPCLVEPDRLPRPRPLTRRSELQGARLALMLGGDAHSHRFGTDDWVDIGRLVREMRNRYGISWIVTNSRRTAAIAGDLMVELVRAGVVDRFIDVRRPGSGSLADLFSADGILVTEDSVSMMSEAVAAQRPVVALRPRSVVPTLVDRIVGDLEESGALRVMPVADRRADELADTLLTATPITIDHRDRIADALRSRLPDLFAGREAP